MAYFSRLWSIWASAIVLLAPLGAQATPPDPAAGAPPAWPVSTAPARFTIEPDQPGPAAVISWVKLFLPNPGWESLPMRVFTDAGVAVGADVLWTSPGEPVTLVFDSSSGAKRYQVYVGSSWPVKHLADAHAGVWLETRAGDGKTVTKLPEMLDAWNKSTTVNGRAIVGGIFEGGNRFGPQDNLFLHLQGWFAADKAEHLGLAITSVDASFVLVDGKEVAEWPGQHEWGYGPQGPPQGAVDVTPGIHVIDFYNAYARRDGGRPPVLDCLSIKGGTFPDWTTLTPDKIFFRPAPRFHAVGYDLQVKDAVPSPTSPPALAFEWTITGQSPINTDFSDLGLVGMQLNCLSPPAKGTLTWTFDDGTTAQGPNPAHTFPRPGMRAVQLAVVDGGKTIASVARTISVHLSWAPIVDVEPVLKPQFEADIMARDPATFSVPDLASAFSIFGGFDQPGDLLKLAPAMSGKMKEVSDADLPYVKEAALRLVREDRDHFAAEEQLMRALVDRCGTATAPPVAGIGSQARLFLAELLLKNSDQTDDVKKLVDAINVPSLAGDDPRTLDILRGDLALATGDVEGARKRYRQLTGDPQGADARSSIRRTAEIGQARTFMERKDYDAAEDALHEVAWQAPIEKLSPDWALTRLRLDQAENLSAAGYYWGRRLLPVISGGGRSELLLLLTELALAQNDGDLAHKSLSELLKKHPYSQEAALAKEKWPAAE